MAASSNGNPLDWERFYLENRRAFLACATAWSGNPGDAADLIQEALLRQLRRNEIPKNARAYVLRSIRNLAIDRKRAARATAALTVDVAAAIDSTAVEADSPVTRANLVYALEQLAVQQREAVLLRAVAGLTIAEVAAVLEKPPGSVASAYARGIDELQRILCPEASHGLTTTGNETRPPAHR